MFLKTFIYLLLQVIINATEDALRDEKFKTWSHLLNSIHVLLWLVFPVIVPFNKSEIGVLIGGYILIRFTFFDFVYNIIRKLPLFYVGDTSIYDKVIRYLVKKLKVSAAFVLSFSKIISILIAYGLFRRFF